IQLIDQWIVDYDEDDDIVEVLSYGQGRDEHTVFVTASLLLNYRYDTILPSLAGGVNINGSDAFLIPAVTFVFGDHWRLNFEANLFFPNNSKEIFGPPENKTHVLGTTADSSVFLTRLSYYF
ncbi:MAG: LysR family transcriptional regulator, partial [Pseudomonadota bacterium]|nr:LysR family transcriptional regulator [Pseudomonadota bacterium]